MQFEFQRYSCQMALPNFTRRKQNRLKNAKVLIVGMGGLGCPVAQYLVAAGIGTVGIVDNDTISLSNLNRQTLYTPEEVGLQKVEVACKKLHQQNPAIQVIPYPIKITTDNVMNIIQQYDIVVDGTDNFTTKYILNDACVLARKPLVYGAIYQYEGHVALLNVANRNKTRTPHYRDLFPDAMNASLPNCSEGGVMPTLAGLVGSMQANEVIKYLIHSEAILAGKLWVINAQTGQSRVIKIGKLSHTQITELPQIDNVPLISREDLRLGLEKGMYDLIDVRTPSEHRIANVGGKSLPMDILRRGKERVRFTKPAVCYCSSGERSAEAVKLLTERYPRQQFFSLAGGIDAWLGETCP